MKKTPVYTSIETKRPNSNKRWLALCSLSSLFCLATSSCQKEAAASHSAHTDRQTQSKFRSEEMSVFNDGSLADQTIRELKDARSATARYQNIQNAIKDGYGDINVVRPEMGYHYMKASLLDASFDPTKPEILVYNKTEKGKMELVALEYAIPISLSPNAAPAGFTGDNDVWKYDTEFGLWLLHAWVWEPKPAGVFNPTNPNVHVH